MKSHRLLLVLILTIAFILRFYKLGLNPPSLDWDENSNAYNAYSILKTAKDQYGNFLPLTNRSFDDYKPPLYMYLNVPTVAVLGLTPFAARLPSAILGFLTVPVTYYLSKKLLESKKIVDPENFALLSAFLLAISPWHVHFSRVGFEANVGLFFAEASIAAIFFSLKKPWFLIVSAILAGISMYSYHSVRIYLPLLLALQIFLFRREIFKIPKKILLVSSAITATIVAPLLLFAPTQAIAQRFEVTTSNLRLEESQKAIDFMKQDKEEGIPFSNIIHNRRFFTAQTMVDNYLWHFDLNFLFVKGDDNFRHHITNMGMLYLWQLPFVIYGIYFSVAKRTKGTLFIIGALLLIPLVAAPARPAPHAVRSLAMVIPLTQLTALAALQLISARKRLYIPLKVIAALVISLSVISFTHNYYIHYPLEKASFWQYGYSFAAEITEKLKGEYKKVRVDGRLEQGYIFWLFATKYDPSLFQKSGGNRGYDKYVFDSAAPESADELYVTVSENFPPDFTVISTVNYPDGREALKIGHPSK